MKNEIEEFLKKEGVTPDSARKRILKTLENWVKLKVVEEVSKRIRAFEKTPAEWFALLNKKIDKIKYGFSRIEMAPGLGVGVGDMQKSVYDTDGDGVVDNSEKLEGNTLTQVRDHAPKAHASSHEEGGSDALTPANIGANWDKLVNKPSTFPPSAHASDHENGGADEIDVTGLSGELADPQPPKAHAASHKDGGDDELDASELAGALGTAGQVLKTDGAAANWKDDIGSITLEINGGGSAIQPGIWGNLRIPFSCEIQSVSLGAPKESGSIKIDIWKSTHANFPPTDADSICGGNEPAISSGQKYEDTTLSGWTKTINAGDWLVFNVDSCTDITLVTLALKVKKI